MSQSRPGRPWIFACCFLAAAVLVPLTCRWRRVVSPPPEMTLQQLVEDGEKIGWEAHTGFQEPDGIGVLFLSRKINPRATLTGGASQPGALFVVETLSPEAARERTSRPGHSEAWGKFWLSGESLMMDELIYSAKPTSHK